MEKNLFEGIIAQGVAAIYTCKEVTSIDATFKRELRARLELALNTFTTSIKEACKVLDEDIIKQGGCEKYTFHGYEVALDATSKKYSFSMNGDAKQIRKDYNLSDDFFKAETTPLNSSSLKEAWLTKSSNELQNAVDAGVISIKETPCITVKVSKADDTISSENKNEGEQGEQNEQ